jgi:signal transduction protein with GAF and PtsI domain
VAEEAQYRPSVEYFSTLFEIAKRLNSSLDPNDVLAYLTESVSEALAAKAASVRLLDESGERLEMRAVYGLSDAYLNKGPVELSRSAVDRHILAGNITQLEDVTQDPNFQYPKEARDEGIVSVLSAPLIAQDRPIGVLRVYSDKPRHFTEVECAFIQAVAELAALAIQNARLHDQLRRDHGELLDLFLPTK